MRWQLVSPDPAKVESLARELGMPGLVARLLVERGIGDAELADRFLNPRIAHLHDPFLMADMRAAVERLRSAVARKEKILIYGDYDVDGTMAVVVLLAALESLGARAEAYIPHRLTDGYGMRLPVVEHAAAEGYRVVVSVDTGIREHEVIGRAQALGLDCIVTDHHLPGVGLPPACAVLNPRRADCPYPDKNLSGVGVAFKLAQALLGPAFSERVIRSYLKLVAIGTVADVVPLVGENRVIAKFGLAELSEPSQPGLAALLEFAGLQGRAITAGDVGFRIGPRLNAAGRMKDAQDVIKLFRTRDESEARAIAERLDRLNRDRQSVEESILAAAEDLIRADRKRLERFSFLFAAPGWHRGVIGIVAQRLVERYHRPTLVVGIEDGIGFGSGRSIPNFHLLNALTESKDLFERFGGHAQAAGFALPAASIPRLEEQFERSARSVLKAEDLEPVLRVDGEMDLSRLDFAFYDQLRRLEPFGAGNPTPVFTADGLRLASPPRVVGEKHLKLKVGFGPYLFDALGWRKADRAAGLRAGQAVKLAFTVGENMYQGAKSLQLILKDIVAPSPSTPASDGNKNAKARSGARLAAHSES
jgi:single-stranded-DNA-specific exonuclease